MYLKIAFFVLALALSASNNAEIRSPDNPSWLVGFWREIPEKQQGLESSLVEFRADGSSMLYQEDCSQITGPGDASYLVFGDEIQLQAGDPGEKPRTLVFRASRDKARLTTISPDDGTTIVLERVRENTCVVQS